MKPAKCHTFVQSLKREVNIFKHIGGLSDGKRVIPNQLLLLFNNPTVISMEEIFRWLISFPTGRSHNSRGFKVESNPLPINLSNVQGFRWGPTLYIFILIESDLKPIYNINVIFKYADDINFVIPECTDECTGRIRSYP